MLFDSLFVLMILFSNITELISTKFGTGDLHQTPLHEVVLASTSSVKLKSKLFLTLEKFCHTKTECET
jgi:hypothetical protein